MAVPYPWTTGQTGVDVAAHKTRHQDGGADEISLTGLSGMPADVLVALNGKDYGLSFEAPVTTYTDTTHFKASILVGKGDGFFKGYYAYVVWDAGGAGAAPQGEVQLVSAFTSSDGTVTHAAFTTPLAVTDIVLLIHPYIAYLLELGASNIPADVDAVKAKTDLIPADITTQLDTNVPAIKAKTDLLPADTTTQLDTNIPAIKAKTDTIVAGGATEANVDAVETKVDAVKTVVDAIPTTAMRGTDDAMLAVNGALEATLTAIKGGGWTTETLKAIKDLVAAIPTTAMRGTDNAALAASWTASLATALGSYTAALATGLGTYTDPKVMGRTQIFEKSITSAANAGDVVVATITTQPCQVESIIIHADAAQTANMTSCGVFGGAGKVITFISATDAIQSNLDAADKQVAWTGVVRLVATNTLVISLAGTGATAVDLTIVIKYRSCVSGGYLV